MFRVILILGEGKQKVLSWKAYLFTHNCHLPSECAGTNSFIGFVNIYCQVKSWHF